jgi:hypothetical protein
MGKKSRSGYGVNIPDHISESLETIFGLKILKFLDLFDPLSGIRDGKNSGSGINVLDPKHWSARSIALDACYICNFINL